MDFEGFKLRTVERKVIFFGKVLLGWITLWTRFMPVMLVLEGFPKTQPEFFERDVVKRSFFCAFIIFECNV